MAQQQQQPEFEFTLTEKEQEVFSILLQVVKELQLKTTLRVAGGWVRDKLLGLSSSSPDIDIALDDTMGQEFANKVKDWLDRHGLESHRVGVVKSNPEKSKHLETATLPVCGVSIDFVNLRTERYTEHSRIPEMDIGTPQEDAERRDFTFNALFYNLNEKKVEDFTGRGISDLKAGILRTPLDPNTTLLDDPLRVLRAVRFASRFGFSMTQELASACASAVVHEALLHKVSRERVGVELDLMMARTHTHSALALQTLVDLGLCHSVFSTPPGAHAIDKDAFTKGMQCVRNFDFVLERFTTTPSLLSPAPHGPTLSADDMRVSRYASILLPLAGLQFENKKRKLVSLCHVIMSDSVKLPSRDADRVCLLHEVATLFRQMTHTHIHTPAHTHTAGRKESDVRMEDAQESSTSTHTQPATHTHTHTTPQWSRVEVGQILRKAGALWQVGLLLAAAGDLDTHIHHAPLPISCTPTHTPAPTPHTHTPTHSVSPQLAERILCVYGGVWGYVCASGLEGVWEMQPLVDGNKVKSVLTKIPKGPQFKIVMDEQIRWQLETPTATVADAEAYLKTKFAEFA